MTRPDTDLLIIGAGSGGLSLAAGAVQMGARVTLVEAGEMGGDCLNVGCVPSKALLAAARQAQAMRKAAPFGIRAVDPEIDFAAVKDHVAAVIAAIAPNDSEERFRGLGVEVIRARARFTAPDTVAAGDRTIRARRIVVATGSRPVVPPIPGLDAVDWFTNETIFALRERPRHLLVLGGGAIGLELAQAHRRLGCAVTVVEGARALAREDPELAAVVLDRLRAEGVEIVEHTRVAAVERADGITLLAEDGRRLSGSHLLLAVGRRVAVDDLGLDLAGVAFDKGGVRVGRNLRSVTNRRVYAIGDAAGGHFTHQAGQHAGVVLRQVLLGLPARADTATIPRALYADPELAQVGLTEAEARARHGDAVTVLRWPLHDNDRAQAERTTEGLAKLIAHRGRVIGAGIAAPHAGDLIAPLTLAVAARLRLSVLAGTVLPYPTLAEVGKRAAGAYFSPKLFDNPWVKRVVRAIQHVLP